MKNEIYLHKIFMAEYPLTYDEVISHYKMIDSIPINILENCIVLKNSTSKYIIKHNLKFEVAQITGPISHKIIISFSKCDLLLMNTNIHSTSVTYNILNDKYFSIFITLTYNTLDSKCINFIYDVSYLTIDECIDNFWGKFGNLINDYSKI